MLVRLLLALFVCAAVPAAGERVADNVLILLADDLGVDSLGAYGEGDDVPITPNLDALAAQGVLFRNAYSNPTCSPTRASLMTGRYPFRTGIGDVIFAEDDYALSLDEVTLPEMLDIGTAGAYSHAAFGKWHLSTTAQFGPTSPNDHGWSHFAGTLRGVNADGGDYFEWTKVVDGVTSTSTAYNTTDTVDEALAWIDTASEPWVAYVAFNAPHTPLHQPPAWLYTLDLNDGNGSPFGLGRGLYKAMIEAMDTEIGRLLASLDPDVADRTTVVFLGDNGTPIPWTVPPFIPEHAKGNIFEGGTNVPLIVAGAAVDEAGSGGTESAALVHVVDVFATVADIAGVDLGAVLPAVTVDGLSLLPYVQSPALPSLRTHLFTEIFCPNYPDATPPEFICQDDLGSGGPGDANLSVCGQVLMQNNTSTLLLDAAAPDALAYMVISLSLQEPFGFAGGTILTSPFVSLVPLYTNGAGQISFTVPANVAPPPLRVNVQFAIVDAAQIFGWEISNAVAIDFAYPLAFARAMRNDHYKLISYTDPDDELNLTFELYDLLADPFELTDLMGGGSLTPEQAAAFGELRGALGALVP